MHEQMDGWMEGKKKKGSVKIHTHYIMTYMSKGDRWNDKGWMEGWKDGWMDGGMD